jgi:hypothetical protein
VFRGGWAVGTVSRRALERQLVNAILKQRAEVAGTKGAEFSARGSSSSPGRGGEPQHSRTRSYGAAALLLNLASLSRFPVMRNARRACSANALRQHVGLPQVIAKEGNLVRCLISRPEPLAVLPKGHKPHVRVERQFFHWEDQCFIVQYGFSANTRSDMRHAL